MAVRSTVSMEGGGEDFTAAIAAAAQAGLALAGERLVALAVDRAPFRDGDLRRSAATSTPLSSRGGDPEVEVIFDTPYAAILHEHPEYNFSKDANPNAQGKYLENAALENKDELGDIVRKQIRGVS